jgi:hypothetical protein
MLYSAMPTLHVTSEEAGLITAFLVDSKREQGSPLLSNLVPRQIRGRHLGIAFIAGALVSGGSLGTIVMARRHTHGINPRRIKSGAPGTETTASAG